MSATVLFPVTSHCLGPERRTLRLRFWLYLAHSDQVLALLCTLRSHCLGAIDNGKWSSTDPF